MGLSKASRAVRWVGVKLLLLSVSLAAVGSVVAPAAGQDIATVTWGGMKLMHLILGTAGAGVSLFFLPQFTGVALGRTVASGVLCAFVGTPLAMAAYARYVGEPLAGAENVLAAALGVFGVYIIPSVMTLGARFKANPGAFLDNLRGKPPGGGQ